MKYYSYVSDAKLDMLFSQIPKSILGRIAVELSIDLKVVSFSLKERPTDQNRYRRLNAVVAYMDKHQDVGSIREPKSWFRGIAPLVQARVGRDDKAVVLYAGDLPNMVLGLTGSLRHVIGDVGSSVHQGSAVAGAIDAYRALRELDRDEAIGESSPVVDSLRRLVERTAFNNAGTDEPCEFMARMLTFRPQSRSESAFLLGTPLYVASADAA